MAQQINLVGENGYNVKYSHNPYSHAANFNTHLEGCLFEDLERYLDDLNVPNDLRRVRVNSFYAASLPMHENKQIPNCPRIFVGGMRHNSGHGVVEALIHYERKLNQEKGLNPLPDPIKIVKLNTCRPHFLVSTRDPVIYQQVLECMHQNGRWVIPDDADDIRRREQTGEWRVKVSMSSYKTAIETPNHIDQEIRVFTRIAHHCPWQVRKNTGGVQLVMEPGHARRLLALSQCALQDTDDSLIFAGSPASQAALNDYVKNLGRNCADMGRVTCTPMRYISIEERR